MPSSDNVMPHDQMHWLKTLIFTHLQFIKAVAKYQYNCANNIKMIKGVHQLTLSPNRLISLIFSMDGWTAGRTHARTQDFCQGNWVQARWSEYGRHEHSCVCVCVCVCMDACMYVYMHVCMCMYVFMHWSLVRILYSGRRIGVHVDPSGGGGGGGGYLNFFRPIETILFHFHMISKTGGMEGVREPPEPKLDPLIASYMSMQLVYTGRVVL